MKKRRGIWIRVDGSPVRFELNRQKGLLVRRHGRRLKVISFQRLYDKAIEQPQLPLA